MLTELLWALGAKQQHDGQKEQGWAGLLFIVLTILLVWKWNEWFYPVLDWIGLVGFADRVGLISQYPQATLFNVLSMIFLLAFSFALICCVIFFVGAALAVFGTTKIGQTLMVYCIAIIFFVPLAIYVYRDFRKRKQPPKETKTEKFMREYHEKEAALFAARIEKYNNTPLLPPPGQLFSGREMHQYNLFMSSEKYHVESLEWVSEKLKETAQVKPFLQQAVLQLDSELDAIFVHDNKTGRFHFLFPNALPATVSGMYNQSFDDEAVLLEALKRYKQEDPAQSPYIVPSLLMKFHLKEDKSILLPEENAQIEPMILSDDQDFVYCHLKYNIPVYGHTLPVLNEREDVQDLINRINTNAYVLKTVVENQGITNEYPTGKQQWMDIDLYKPVYSEAVRTAMEKLNNLGYSWSVKNE